MEGWSSGGVVTGLQEAFVGELLVSAERRRPKLIDSQSKWRRPKVTFPSASPDVREMKKTFIMIEKVPSFTSCTTVTEL